MTRSTILIVAAATAALAAGGGYLAGRSSASTRTPPARAASLAEATPAPVYTCSMHPQVRLPAPGNCPICEMPLIPAASASAASVEAPTLQLSEHALAMASIETVAVMRRPLSRELRAVGRIEYNESSLAAITPRVDGYVERLFVNFTGVEIRKGDHLAEVYSPELLVAQQELLVAIEPGAGADIAEMARTRLRLLGLTPDQIAELAEHKHTTDRVTLYSPISGTVIEKNILEKGAFKAGDSLFRIANLDSVWVYLDIYEYDLPWVRYGQRVRLTAEALPGRAFDGLVTFVQPIVNDQSRTVRVPVHVENKDHALKPGMFVAALIDAALTHEGRAAPTGVEGRFSCPMHPQVLTDDAGACPFCQMPLERIPAEPAPPAAPAGPAGPRYICPMKCEGDKSYDKPGPCPDCNMNMEPLPPDPVHDPAAGVLAVPVSAVLDSGTRCIVFVEKARGLFEPRELTLGPRAGDYFPVLAGLNAGERVAVRGNFLIDSQFQITGHPSLLYPGGLHASMEHEQGDASTPPAPGLSSTADEQPTSPAHKH